MAQLLELLSNHQEFLYHTKTTNNDYWIDDVSFPDYNKWVTYEGNPDEKWNSYERLRISDYKYAVVINYNTSNIQPGKGSAIFLTFGRVRLRQLQDVQQYLKTTCLKS